jgi:predicted DNA-binding transcriptional regulator YafY
MKTATRPQYHRLRRILEMVREGTRSGPLPNRGDFIRELEVSSYHGNWYLLALNRVAGRMETFARSRCRFIAGTEQHFARLPGFGARAFLKDAFGIGQAEKPRKVCLLFAKELAVYVGEWAWHPSQRLRQRRDGSLEMRLETSGRKELTRWILSWVPHVRVLAPR